MIAIVTAGGEIGPKEPLFEITHGGIKSMIDIQGKPMIQWVLDALGECQYIDQVIVVGLPPETNLDCTRPLHLLANQGDMISNIQAGAEEITRIDPNETHALQVSGDIPGLRSEIIDWLMCQTKDLDQDIYYTVIERAAMEIQFPSSRRSYVHLKGIQVCGGYLHCFRLQAVTEGRPPWKRLVESRKSPIRQASILGYDTLLFLMLRQLTLKDAEAAVSKRLGIKGKALLSPYPEIGIDIDKPFQLEIIREYLSGRHERHPASTE